MSFSNLCLKMWISKRCQILIVASSFLKHSQQELIHLENSWESIKIVYAVCIKSHSLYNINACVEKHGGETYSNKCPFVKYPNHPQKHQQKECGQKLMKEIKTTSGNVAFVPQKFIAIRQSRVL